MNDIARGQITINTLDNEHTFIKYSDDLETMYSTPDDFGWTDFRPVEYIYNHYQYYAYITIADAGDIGTSMRIVIEFMVMNTYSASTTASYIFGNWIDSTNYYFLRYNRVQNRLEACISASSSAETQQIHIPYQMKTKIKVDMSAERIIVNDTDIYYWPSTRDTTTFSQPYAMRYFNSTNKGTLSSSAYRMMGRIYTLKVYQDDVLKVDNVAVVNLNTKLTTMYNKHLKKVDWSPLSSSMAISFAPAWELSENRILNGDFSKGLDSWETSYMGDAMTAEVVEDQIKGTCLKLASTNVSTIDANNNMFMDTMSTDGNRYLQNTPDLEGDQMLSFDAKCNASGNILYVYARNATKFRKVAEVEMATNWKRYEVPISTISTHTERVAFALGSPNKDYYLTNIKMEYGTVATGWSPSPDDVATISSRNGIYMGTLVWENNYPSPVFSDYTWVKVKGADGTNGRGIASITEYYLATSSSSGITTSSSGWTATVQAVTNTKKYLWNYEIITYTDGTTTETTPHIIGVYGDVGNNGKGISSITNYYLATTSSSGVTRSTSGWTTTVQAITATKKYLWNYEDIQYTDNTHTYTDPHIIGVYGEKGDDGDDGRGITSVTEYYLASASSSGVTRSTSGWTAAIQSVTSTKKYLWNYEDTLYTDNTHSYTTPVIIGVYGDKGDDGKGITSITNYYLATSASSGVTRTTSGWTTAIQTVTSAKKYLWNYEDILYTDNTHTYTSPHIIGVYGDKGDKGDKGDSVQGADAEFYQLVPLVEKAVVGSDGTLGVSFQYNIQHIKGSTITNVTANTASTVGNHYVRFRRNTTTTYTNLSSNTTSPTYTNNSYQTNYHTQTTQIEYFICELVRVTSASGSVTIVDKSLVPVIFAAGATLQITDDIQATVTDHTTQISNLDGRVTTNTNNISSVTQTANSLSSTVQSHTTSINNLNGTVSGHTTQISNLQQTASGITSMVESISVGTRNLFLGTKILNTTYCTINSGTRYTVADTGEMFDGFTAVWAKAKTSADTDLLAWNGVIEPEPETYYSLSFWCKGVGTIKSYFHPSTVVYGYNSDGNEYGSLTTTTCGDGALVTNLTSDWKRVWIVWKTGTSAKMTSGLKNVIVARIPSGATTNEAHICGVKFEKSSLPSDYSEAPEDIDSRFLDDANLFKGSSFDGGYISPSVPSNRWEIRKGTMECTLMQLAQFGTLFSEGTFDMSPSSAGTAYLYSPYIYFSANTPITLSLNDWDWGDNDTEIQIVKFSTGASARNIMNGTVATTLNFGNVKHYTITAAAYYRIGFKTTVQDYDEDNGDYYLTLNGIRLYKGTLSAYDVPKWDYRISDTYSKISQTAHQITLQVQDVALRIDNKKIVLDGDTEINGSLTMDNSDQGFLLIGEGGNTQISPQSIGTYNTFSNLSTRTVTTSVSTYSTLSEETGTDYYIGHFSTSANLGDLPTGSIVTLKNQSLSFRKPNSGNTLTAYNISAKYTIYENGTSKKTVTITSASSTNITTYTTSAAATVTVGLVVTASFQTSDWTSGTLDKPSALGTLYFQSLIPTTAFMLIGYDGLAVNFGSNKTAYFGGDSAIIKYGSQGLQINNNGIKKLNPNGGNVWTNLSTLKVTLLPNSDYTLADADEFLIAKSYTSDHKLNLPTISYTGRVIYVKDYTASTIQVYCSGHLVNSNSTSTTSQININNTSGMFIFDGTNWIYYYCG